MQKLPDTQCDSGKILPLSSRCPRLLTGSRRTRLYHGYSCIPFFHCALLCMKETKLPHTGILTELYFIILRFKLLEVQIKTFFVSFYVELNKVATEVNERTYKYKLFRSTNTSHFCNRDKANYARWTLVSTTVLLRPSAIK